MQAAFLVQEATPSVALLAGEQANSGLVTLLTRTYDDTHHRGKQTRLMIATQIGKVGELEEVDEYRVEAMCMGRDVAIRAVEALKK